MHKIFSGNTCNYKNYPLQCEQFSLKKMKEIYVPAKIINPHAKASGQLNFSFENESTMCKVIAVMIAK